MHRRPLGRGRLLAAIASIVVVVGCVLPWYTIGGALAAGLPVTTMNAFDDKGIVVFIGALLVLALVSLPYAADDKPVALDRTLSYGILTGGMLVAFLWRLAEFTVQDIAGLRPDLSPGTWLVVIGLAILVRAIYEISRERRI